MPPLKNLGTPQQQLVEGGREGIESEYNIQLSDVLLYARAKEKKYFDFSDEGLDEKHRKDNDVTDLISVIVGLEKEIHEGLMKLNLPKDSVEAVSEICTDIIRKRLQEASAPIVSLSHSDEAEHNSKDELGRPLHPLEVEVNELVDRAQAGEKVLPDYDRDKHTNPIGYLELELGKYLKRFNGGKGNYLYLFQLRKLNPKFYQTLIKHFSRNPQDKIDTIPDKSDHVNMEAEVIRDMNLYNQKLHSKIASLKRNKKLNSA